MKKRVEKPEELRQKAIRQFDKAIRLYYTKRNREAAAEFKKILREYSGDGFLDIINKAKQYISFCELPSKHPSEEETKYEVKGKETVPCPNCKSPLLVGKNTVQVWCESCEGYVASPEIL